jgi:putative ATP-dependent endonuclease of OLD family
MYISKIHIENFKSFKGSFKLLLDKGINIIVGENEAGKSTIIEAIHLALSGLLNGKYLNNELTQYIFNYEVIKEYLDNLSNGVNSAPPHILIEIFIEGDGISEFEGNGNSEKSNFDFINSSLAAFIDSHFEVDRVTYNIYLDRIEIIE